MAYLWSHKHLGKRYNQVIKDVIKIQSFFKGKCARQKFEKLVVASVALQTTIRTGLATLLFAKQWRSILLIQSKWRSHVQRTRYLQIVDAALLFQTYLRRSETLLYYQRWQQSVLVLQTLIRAWDCRRAFCRQKRSAVCVQKNWRCKLESNRYRATKKAAEVFQTNMRMAAPHNYFVRLQISLVTAQAAVRRYLAIKRVKEMLANRFQTVRNQLLQLWDNANSSWLRRALFLSTFQNISIRNLLLYVEEGKRLLADERNDTKKELTTEEKGLYNKLKAYKPEYGINELFIKWKVDPTGKKRKHRLLKKFFINGTVYEDAKASSDLILAILGMERACEESSITKPFGMKEFNVFVNTTKKSVAESANSSQKCTVL